MTSPKKAVGRVYVRVVPDTKGFAADLKADLAEIRRQNPLDIIVDGDFTKVEAELRRLSSHRWTASVAVDADTTQAHVALDRIELQLQRLTRHPWTINVGVTTDPLQYRRIEAALDALTRDRTVDVDVDLNAARARAELAVLTRDRRVRVSVDTDRSALSRLGSSLRGLGGAGTAGGTRGSLTASLTSLLTLAPRAIRSMTKLRLTIGTLVAAAVATAPAVGVLSQALLVVPAVALAGAAALGVLAIAFSNFSDAEGAAGDVRQAFTDMKEGWETLRTAVQENFFAGLADPIRELGQKWLPLLTTELGNLAGAMNKGAREFITFLNKPSTIDDTATGLQNTTKFMDGLARATQPFLQAMTDISVVGSEFLPGFGDSIARAAENFSDFTAKARESGELKKWIQDGLDGFKSLGRSVRNIFQGFGAIFDTLGIKGLGILSVLEKVTETFKSLANDPVLQGGLAAFFEDAKAAIDNLFSTAVAFLPRLIAAVGPALGSIVTTVGDILSRGIAMITPVVEALGPPLEKLAEHIDDVFGPIIDGLGPTMEAIGQTLIVLGGSITDVFGAVVRTVAPIITQLATPIQDLITSLGSGLVGAIENMGPGLDTLAGAFERIEPTLSSIVEDFLPKLGTIFSEDIAPPLGDFVENVVPKLLEFFDALAEPAGDLAGSILTAIGDFAEGALPGLREFGESVLPQITGLVDSIDWTQLGTDVGSVLDSAGELAETVGPMLAETLTALQPIVSDLVSIFGDLVPLLGGVISGILWFVNGVLEDMGRVTGFIADLADGDWAAAWNDLMPPVTQTADMFKDETGGWAGWLQTNVWDPIGKNAKDTWDNVKSDIGSAIDGIGKFFTDTLPGWVGWLDTNVWQPIKANAVSAFTDLKNDVTGILGGLKDWASGLWQDIVDIFAQPIIVDTPSGPGFDTSGPGGGPQPAAANGAVVTPTMGGTLWRVGEAGQTEIIAPVPMLDALNRQSEQRLARMLGGGSNGNPTNNYPAITLNHYGPGELAPEAVIDALKEWERTHR